MDDVTPKYHKGNKHVSPKIGFWRVNSRPFFRRSFIKWRAFLFFVIVISFISLNARYSHFKKIWSKRFLTSNTLGPPPWTFNSASGNFTGYGTQVSFWEKFRTVSKLASCLSSCPLPFPYHGSSKRLSSMERILQASNSSKRSRNNNSCPLWFQYIYEDLSPWMESGVQRKNLEESQPMAAFHVIIHQGRLFVKHFFKCPESRELFTLWGLSQLLRRYPGKVPDLEMMFDCSIGGPLIQQTPVRSNKTKLRSPPFIFRYTGTENGSEVAFPDWTFWGWPEARVPSWDRANWQLIGRNSRQPWRFRRQLAHWKGYRAVSGGDPLAGCHGEKRRKTKIDILGGDDEGVDAALPPEHDTTQLMEQPYAYRFKIFPGDVPFWPQSLKYFLSLGSVTLVPELPRHTFFSRGLVPGTHFWPINGQHVCDSIHFAVDFGNAHVDRSINLTANALSFVQTQVNLDRVYDYMYHLLSTYAGLQRFEPTVPESAYEICPEFLTCLATPDQREFLRETENARRQTGSDPCELIFVDKKTWEETESHNKRMTLKIENCEKWGVRNADFCKI